MPTTQLWLSKLDHMHCIVSHIQACVVSDHVQSNFILMNLFKYYNVIRLIKSTERPSFSYLWEQCMLNFLSSPFWMSKGLFRLGVERALFVCKSVPWTVLPLKNISEAFPLKILWGTLILLISVMSTKGCFGKSGTQFKSLQIMRLLNAFHLLFSFLWSP